MCMSMIYTFDVQYITYCFEVSVHNAVLMKMLKPERHIQNLGFRGLDIATL